MKSSGQASGGGQGASQKTKFPSPRINEGPDNNPASMAANRYLRRQGGAPQRTPSSGGGRPMDPTPAGPMGLQFPQRSGWQHPGTVTPRGGQEQPGTVPVPQFPDPPTYPQPEGPPVPQFPGPPQYPPPQGPPIPQLPGELPKARQSGAQPMGSPGADMARDLARFQQVNVDRQAQAGPDLSWMGQFANAAPPPQTPADLALERRFRQMDASNRPRLGTAQHVAANQLMRESQGGPTAQSAQMQLRQLYGF